MGHYVAWAPTCVNMVYELEGNLLDGPLLHATWKTEVRQVTCLAQGHIANQRQRWKWRLGHFTPGSAAVILLYSINFNFCVLGTKPPSPIQSWSFSPILNSIV